MFTEKFKDLNLKEEDLLIISNELADDEMREQMQSIKNKFVPNKKREGVSYQFHIGEDILKITENNLSQYETAIYERTDTYIRALVHEYASMPHEERELIYYKEICNTINFCAYKGNHKAIIISTKTQKNKIHRHYFQPYCIMPDISSGHNYVIGKSREYGTSEDMKVKSFKLQNIVDIDITEDDFSFSKDDVDNLSKHKINPVYASFPNKNIIVILTNDGYNTLYKKSILLGRPSYTNYKSLPDGRHKLTFECSEFQAYNYFIKFGKDVEIISPERLRNQFAELHDASSKDYFKSDDKDLKVEKIGVKLTKQGYELYDKTRSDFVGYRSKNIQSNDKNPPILTFYCTLKQAEEYFSKFDPSDVKIIYPKELKKIETSVSQPESTSFPSGE